MLSTVVLLSDTGGVSVGMATRSSGCVFKQNDRTDTQMKNTDMADITWGQKERRVKEKCVFYPTEYRKRC